MITFLPLCFDLSSFATLLPIAKLVFGSRDGRITKALRLSKTQILLKIYNKYKIEVIFK